MYSNSRGILYTTPPTADDNAEDAADETADTTEELAEDATVTEANANWAGELTADD